MQTQEHEQPPNKSSGQEHENLPWGRLAIVSIVIIFLAIFGVIFIYLNTGAAILFAILTVLGLIFAFLQVVPSLFPSKKSSSSPSPIIIHTPHIQPTSVPPSLTNTIPNSQNTSDSLIHPEKTQHVKPEQSYIPDPILSIWHVPYRRNPLFTDREDILERLHRSLTVEKSTIPAQLQAITGLGGIGKTQTAIEYAYRYRKNYQAVFWAKAESLDTLVSDFVTIAGLLKLPEYNTQDLNIAIKAVKRWFEKNTNWLLIFDNADDLTIVSNFLPPQSRGHILLTTRAQAMSGMAQSIEIDKMKPEEGALFILRRASIISKEAFLEDASNTDRIEAQAISEAMDGLPLALDQAGAFIEETSCSLSEYLSLYREKHSALLRRRGGLISDHPELVTTTWALSFESDHPEPVTTTWALSFEKVEQNNPTAAELLRLCAFLYHDAIPEEIIVVGARELGPILRAVATDKLVLNTAIGELRKFSFVRRNPDINTLSIHRLVQVILKDGMDKDEQYQWAERTVRAVNRIFPNLTFATWQQSRQYLPQIQACAELIKQYEFSFPEAPQLLDQGGYFLQEHAYYLQAEELYLQALVIREATVGPEHPDTAITLNNLAWLYYIQGKYTQAEPLYLRALVIREATVGPEHPDTATTLNNLARLYHAQGKYTQAEPLYLRALTIYEKTKGPEHPDTATTLNNLALLYGTQGKYTQAEPLYLRALAIRETVLGLEHPDVATVLENYVDLLYKTKRAATAAKLSARVQFIRAKYAN